jgi:hypothetical protein
MATLLKVVASGLTGFLLPSQQLCCRPATSKIDQSMPIVAETEQVANRRNSHLKSRVRISDGSRSRFFALGKKICAKKSARYHSSK